MEIHTPDDINIFKQKALQWAASFETACYFDSNNYTDPYSSFDVLIAAGSVSEIEENAGSAFEKLSLFLQNNPDWVLGFLGYDLKNELEELVSSNHDELNFPDLYFFKPLHLIKIKGSQIEIISPLGNTLLQQIEAIVLNNDGFSFNDTIQTRLSKDEYIETVNLLKNHIRRGDIYEVNYCQEFYSANCLINPLQAFNVLNKVSPTPFATYLKFKSKHIICATPERFLSKRDNKIISQPIKGTVKRSKDVQEDQHLKNSLRNNVKEQSENVMIVDLVRNDLTKCAIPGTVRVEELFGIYSFEQVHQMISTIVCEAGLGVDNIQILKSLFPMGSMTGAPKISAMQIIDKYEKTKRGIFSGAIGYFAPNGDFDFNVVIRTLLYNSERKYISYQVGSAITFASEPGQEYEECLLKAKAIRQILSV